MIEHSLPQEITEAIREAFPEMPVFGPDDREAEEQPTELPAVRVSYPE